ncbi:hypothetical protein H0H87_000258 [Tephrocybe sp. NHM501043]|nr:hypothetical protein H0H87_000258 [Tephrocybe sp. NHM501043]
MSPQWFKKNKAKFESPLQPLTGAPKPDNNDLLQPEATDNARRSIFSSFRRTPKGFPISSSTISPTPSRSSTPEPPAQEQQQYVRIVFRVLREWELDREFLAALTTWERDHPQSTLSNILQKVSDAIEKRKPLIGVIPDVPFPAQSLVKEFVPGVLEWITGLKSTIASFGDEEITKVEWKNLAKVREIIDKICQWAESPVVDKRWTKLNMDNEIAEFEMLIQNARQVFTVRDPPLGRMKAPSPGGQTVIPNSPLGHVAYNDFGKYLHSTQDSPEDPAGTQRAGGVSTEEIAAEKARKEAVCRALDPHTAAQATYDQQGKLPCNPGTREHILDTIRGWTERSQNFLWLTGVPGCGKSAVTATITRGAKDKGYLWAQLFINRNLEQTTSPDMYFPTIVRQLSDISNKVEHHLYDTVQQTPSVADHMPSTQAAELFIGVVAEVSKLNPESCVSGHRWSRRDQ